MCCRHHGLQNHAVASQHRMTTSEIVYVANRYLGATVAGACIKQPKRQHE
jgi:hypothetical protein